MQHYQLGPAAPTYVHRLLYHTVYIRSYAFQTKVATNAWCTLTPVRNINIKFVHTSFHFLAFECTNFDYRVVNYIFAKCFENTLKSLEWYRNQNKNPLLLDFRAQCRHTISECVGQSCPYEVVVVELRLLRRWQRWFVQLPLVVLIHTHADDIPTTVPTAILNWSNTNGLCNVHMSAFICWSAHQMCLASSICNIKLTIGLLKKMCGSQSYSAQPDKSIISPYLHIFLVLFGRNRIILKCNLPIHNNVYIYT